jgi:hypothetical protein
VEALLLVVCLEAEFGREPGKPSYYDRLDQLEEQLCPYGSYYPMSPSEVMISIPMSDQEVSVVRLLAKSAFANCQQLDGR